MAKRNLLLLVSFFSIAMAQAKIWRVNNTAGVAADFTSLTACVASASVLAGDTVHVEPSATTYNGISPTKKLVYIGVGYFLNPADPSRPGNSGLQVSIRPATISGMTFQPGSEGSRCIGLNIGGISFGTTMTALNISLEKCWFTGDITFNTGNYSNFIVRKCFFETSINVLSGSLANFTCENSIFAGCAGLALTNLSGTANIFRNNNWVNTCYSMAIANCYVANNIFSTGVNITFTNAIVKNNLFSNSAASQTVPTGAVGNQFSVNMNNVFVSINSGSYDGRWQLKPGSPAIGAGVTISGYTPDCGAYGATDPYKLSGIPNVPAIYGLTVPTTISAGTATMNVSVSTRNNN